MSRTRSHTYWFSEAPRKYSRQRESVCLSCCLVPSPRLQRGHISDAGSVCVQRGPGSQVSKLGKSQMLLHGINVSPRHMLRSVCYYTLEQLVRLFRGSGVHSCDSVLSEALPGADEVSTSSPVLPLCINLAGHWSLTNTSILHLSLGYSTVTLSTQDRQSTKLQFWPPGPLICSGLKFSFKFS